VELPPGGGKFGVPWTRSEELEMCLGDTSGSKHSILSHVLVTLLSWVVRVSARSDVVQNDVVAVR
jgi:hypothetical protein